MRILGMYAFVLLLDGSGDYGDAFGTRRKVSAGDVICVFPDLPHFYGPGKGEHWHEIYITFEGLLFDLWRQQKILNPERPIWKLHPPGAWYRRIRMTLCPAAPVDAHGAFHHLSRFQMLVADMRKANRAAGSGARQDEAWLLEACRLLEREGGAMDLSGLARKLGLSYENFRKKFSERMGLGPAHYHQARLIDRACALLLASNEPNKKIAEKLGFCDEFHFSKIFRKRMGLSPRMFRAKASGRQRKAPTA